MTSSSTALTTKDNIRIALKSAGFDTSAKILPASGVVVNSSYVYAVTGVWGDASNLYVVGTSMMYYSSSTLYAGPTVNGSSYSLSRNTSLVLNASSITCQDIVVQIG